MKKLLAIVLFIPVLLAGCSSDCIKDSGNHIAKGLTVKPFDKIDVSGAIKLILKQDSTYGIKIEADSNLMEYIKADVSGSELVLKMKKGSYCGEDSVVIYVGIGELKELTGAGAVKIATDGHIYAKDVDLNFAGASEVSLNLNAANVTTRIDGVGKLKLAGQAGSHRLTTTGSAEIDAFNFIAGAYDIHVTGTGKANINVLNDLKVKTEGSSEIYYKGNPQNIDENKTGAAKLEKVN
ncbi:MAG: head GIN domain-containing protein [Bacteroidota bacterium]